MELSRRTTAKAILAAPILGMALSTIASPASAASYATVILSPHQDDETLRGSGYITFAADRGDSIRLVNVTNGAATGVRGKLGLTRAEIIRWRDREQSAAWDWLTDGRGGSIIRLGFEDGQAKRSSIRTAVQNQLSGMTGSPELYVATYPYDRPDAYIPSAGGGDAHVDHIACVQAARDLESDGVTVRYMRHPDKSNLSGAKYDTTTKQFYRVQGAVAAYRTIGQRSVPEQFDSVLAARGRSVIVR